MAQVFELPHHQPASPEFSHEEPTRQIMSQLGSTALARLYEAYGEIKQRLNPSGEDEQF